MPSVSPRAATSVTRLPSKNGDVFGTGSPLRSRSDSPTTCRSGPGSGCLHAGRTAHVTNTHSRCAPWSIACFAMRRYLRFPDVSTPIVAFAKDWHEDPTSNHHVLRELARTRRVLWLNSIATRTPKLGSARDVGKIRR